jgi:hypothetical protein
MFNTVNSAFETTSQIAHWLTGALVVVLFAWYFNKPGYGATLVFLWSVGKEFWWDMKYETADVSGGFWGSFRDFVFYNIGIAGGYGFWYLHALV